MLYWLRLRKIRIREQEKLDEYTLKKFNKITEYIKASNLKYFEKEEALQQIMDMILQLKAEEKSLDPIFDEYEDFCKSIIKEYTSDKNRIYTVLHYIQRIIIIMSSIMVPTKIFFSVFYPKSDTIINIHVFLVGLGIVSFFYVFTHKNIKTRISFGIYIFFFLLVDGNIQQTELGGKIENILVNNTNFVFLALIIIAVLIEIYKRIYDKMRVLEG